MELIKLHIASLSGKEIKEDVREVYIETYDGVVGVLAGHQPEFHSIGAGEVSYIKEDGEQASTIVYDGFVQIESDTVRIGVKDILESKSIDVKEIKSEIENLKSTIKDLPEEDSERVKEIEREIEKRELLIKKADAS